MATMVTQHHQEAHYHHHLHFQQQDGEEEENQRVDGCLNLDARKNSGYTAKLMMLLKKKTANKKMYNALPFSTTTTRCFILSLLFVAPIAVFLRRQQTLHDKYFVEWILPWDYTSLDLFQVPHFADSTITTTTRKTTAANVDTATTKTKTTIPQDQHDSIISTNNYNYPPNYDWTKSTAYNYQSDDATTYGDFRQIRDMLDYSYHANYTKERQLFQDRIIHAILSSSRTANHESTLDSSSSCHNTTTTTTTALHHHHQKHHSRLASNTTSVKKKKIVWIIFTAGSFGAGKSWTIQQLAREGIFPLDSFVKVDADEIRHVLPEFANYVEQNAEFAGEWTRHEAGFVAELVTLVALLQKRRHVLVDGSLRDASWYTLYFEQLREYMANLFHNKQQQEWSLKIGILHITAPRHAILERVAHRGRQTGRVIPSVTLEATMEQVPRSVARLKPLVDFYAQLHNPGTTTVTTNNNNKSNAILKSGIELRTSNMTWESFTNTWKSLE